tara:strand:- start:12411 stop:13931 length:1521 start_codon:yes stop_codon:yes gene_type:complete
MQYGGKTPEEGADTSSGSGALYGPAGATTGEAIAKPGTDARQKETKARLGTHDPIIDLYKTEEGRATRNPFGMYATGPEDRETEYTLGGYGPEGVDKKAREKPREPYQDLADGYPASPKYRYGVDDIDLVSGERLPGIKRPGVRAPGVDKDGNEIITPDMTTDADLDDMEVKIGPDGKVIRVPRAVQHSPEGLPGGDRGTKDECTRIQLVPNKVSCEGDGDCNIIFGNGKNKCLGGKCRCVSGNGTFCHLKSDYYKKLCEMTPAQVVKFKKNAKLEKMTIRDYIKWLSLFKYDVENLPRQHLRNFQRYMRGLPIYDIPLQDPTEEFFASRAAKQDRVCLDIPNAEIDSPLNYKIRSTLDNSGMINRLEDTVKPLNWSRYYGHQSLAKDRYERTNDVSIKDWFMNNINWMFYDIDRNASYRDPNRNRFMNVLDQNNVAKLRSSAGIKPGFTAQRLARDSAGLLPTQEGMIAPASNVSNYKSALDPNPVDLRTGVSADSRRFLPVQDA